MARAAALLSAGAASAAGAAPGAVRVDPATGHWVDGLGRVRIFHGVNVVYKEEPWYPPGGAFDPLSSFGDEDMRNLEEWGFNAVRLGVMWPGVETAPGQINAAYLDAVEGIVTALGQHGVYTIADLHQDLLSRHFCGEGVPEFYVDALLANASSRVGAQPAFPLPAYDAAMALNASGYPALPDCLQNMFSSYYGAQRVGALWRELYTPGTDLHAGFLRHWAAVAGRFGAGAPSLLGYELINEPSAQCLNGADGCKALPELTNKPMDQYMAPLFRAAAAEIRKVDPARPILYEAQPQPLIGSAPFSEPVLGDDPQQALAYHIYCQPGDGNGTLPGTECLAAQDIYASEFFGFLKKHRSVGGFMTEFGAVGPSAGELKHLDRLLGMADDHLQSWSYWQLKKFGDFTTANDAESLYDGTGALETAKLRTLSRTYAQAVAGEPVSMSFDPDTAFFALDYNATLPGAATEVYLNEAVHYPDGFTAAVLGNLSCAAVTRQHNRVVVTASAGCVGQVLQLRIAPGPCRCGAGSGNPGSCCSSNNAGGKGTGGFCGNDFHSQLCGGDHPVCCTNCCGASVCCRDGQSCHSPALGDNACVNATAR